MKRAAPQSQARGDKTSPVREFEMLYADCFRGVYGYIASRVQDPHTAEDLTSEAFLKAWRRWPPQTLGGNLPKAWLYQIAHNLVIDHYRARGRGQQTLPLNGIDAPSPQDNPGEEGHLRRLALRMALASLPPRDQDLLSLRLAGLSNRELGLVLGLTEAAAGMACLRALRRLRDKLEERP
jgi:RNA polymerase sigma-70 factor, ECF subfamily